MRALKIELCRSLRNLPQRTPPLVPPRRDLLIRIRPYRIRNTATLDTRLPPPTRSPPSRVLRAAIYALVGQILSPPPTLRPCPRANGRNGICHFGIPLNMFLLEPHLGFLQPALHLFHGRRIHPRAMPAFLLHILDEYTEPLFVGGSERLGGNHFVVPSNGGDIQGVHADFLADGGEGVELLGEGLKDGAVLAGGDFDFGLWNKVVARRGCEQLSPVLNFAFLKLGRKDLLTAGLFVL